MTATARPGTVSSAARVRDEQPADLAAISAIVRAVFPTHAEARLVDELRGSGLLTVSLVAEVHGAVVGHVAFSPVSVAGLRPAVAPQGLAPLSVAPENRRRGIGAALVEAGLERCRAQRVPFVVLIGDPAYYRRFGFRPATDLGLVSDYDAGDAFMAMETTAGGLQGVRGRLSYAAPFADV